MSSRRLDASTRLTTTRVAQLIGRAALVELLDRESLQQGRDLGRRAVRGIRARASSVSASNALRAIGSTNKVDVRATAHQLGRLHGPAQRVELAPIDRPFDGGARLLPARRGSDVRPGERWPRPRPRMRSGSMSSRPASFMTYWSRTRSFGMLDDDRGRALRAARARPFERRRVGRREQPVDAELEERRRALHRARPTLAGSSLPHVGRDRDRREIGDLELHLETLLPLVATFGRGLARRRRRRTRA